MTAPPEYRVRVVDDPGPDWSWLDEFAGESPDDYLALGVVAERRCPCCGQWETLGSLWGVTFDAADPPRPLDRDDPLDLDAVRFLLLQSHDATRYLGEVARGLLPEGVL